VSGYKGFRPGRVARQKPRIDPMVIPHNVAREMGDGGVPDIPRTDTLADCEAE
jgi:hypothetical protein